MPETLQPQADQVTSQTIQAHKNEVWNNPTRNLSADEKERFLSESPYLLRNALSPDQAYDVAMASKDGTEASLRSKGEAKTLRKDSMAEKLSGIPSDSKKEEIRSLKTRAYWQEVDAMGEATKVLV